MRNRHRFASIFDNVVQPVTAPAGLGRIAAAGVCRMSTGASADPVRWVRDPAAVGTLAALLAALVAGMSVVLPIEFADTGDSARVQLNLLAYEHPQAIAVGAALAMVTAVVVHAIDRARSAWVVAVSGLTVLLADHLVGRTAHADTLLITLNFLDTAAGGVVLGAVGVAVLGHRMPAMGWTAGLLGSMAVGLALPGPHGRVLEQTAIDRTWPGFEVPPLWLIALTLAVAVIAAISHRDDAHPPMGLAHVPVLPVVGAVQLIVARLLGAEWLVRHGDSGPAVVAAVAVGIAATLLAALSVPGRDGEAVVLAVGLSAVGGAVTPLGIPGWAVLPAAALLAVGMLVGTRRPAPALVLSLLAGLAGVVALTVRVPQPLPVIGATALLALLAGCCFGTTSVAIAPARVLAAVLVLQPSVVLALRDFSSRGHFDEVLGAADRWMIFPPGAPRSPVPALVAAVIVVGCLGCSILLRRLRPAWHGWHGREGRPIISRRVVVISNDQGGKRVRDKDSRASVAVVSCGGCGSAARCRSAGTTRRTGRDG
ncbi:hypothetical protein [Nocardia sp. IFM 10818]